MIGSWGERDLRALAVGVGDLQLVAVAALDHVGDARREHALLAGELLVDEVGDAVRGRRAACSLRQRVGAAAERRLLDHVAEPEAHVEAAVGAARHRADAPARRRGARATRRS